MSTLTEIEAAADALPPEQQEQLLAHLIERLHWVGKAVAASPVPFRMSRRGFPISKGRVPFSSQDVARMEAAADEAK